MPIIWRFLLKQYSKVLLLCIVSFIAILLTTRLDEIAQFTALGASSPYVLKFISYQIPYILPVAIPIASLISTTILMQRLSASCELTALRACGYSLLHIATPLLLMAAVLSMGNFYIISEMTTHSHLMKKVLRREIKSLNPLVLLQNEKLARMRGIYAHVEGGLAMGEQASNLIVASFDSHQKDLNLVFAKNLTSTFESVQAEQVTMIFPRKNSDRLLIENAERVSFPLPDLSQLFGGADLCPKDDHLKLSLLLQRAGEYRQTLRTSPSIPLRKQLKALYSEIVRRLSLSLSIFTFTLIAIAFSIHLTPRQMYRGLIWISLLSTGLLLSYFTAKSLHSEFTIAISLYLLPHPLIALLCYRTLKRFNRGQIT